MEQQTSLLKDVVIRFSGDSGDGMQLTGTLFSETLALSGNVISTFPDYPAEIRAPQGTVAGVSGFQVRYGSSEVNNPGDMCDLLVAMNPAALKANARFLKPDATVIIDADSITADNLKKATFQTEDPIAELNLSDRNIISVRITTMTREALENIDIDLKSKTKCKNMFALGICLYITNRQTAHAHQYIEDKFLRKSPVVAQANDIVVEAGYNYAAANHLVHCGYAVDPAGLPAGKYRTINGNVATAWGFIAAAERAGLRLFCGSYPITPATTILEELAKHKALGVTTVQAEDEIAGICTAIGAAFAGRLAVTTTSGPGLALKSEALGLAVMAELPLVVVDVQRGGPSTGLPTKTEQADLLQALYGRNGESPVVVIAPSSPADCFYKAFNAARIALERMVPVILLTDSFVGNASEAWEIPDVNALPQIVPSMVYTHSDDPAQYAPYKRGTEGQRKWAIPGMPNFEHRIGGLEKDAQTGNISYDQQNHQAMVEARANKVEAVVEYVPDAEIFGAEKSRLLVVSWGSTKGHVQTALRNLINQGKQVAMCHLSYIHPLPGNFCDLLDNYDHVLVCELNGGQLTKYLQSQFPNKLFFTYNNGMGQPFSSDAIEKYVNQYL